jgi:Zn-dependent protease with chaperone function
VAPTTFWTPVVALSWLGLLIGIFPTRRRILEETWTLGAYLHHVLRFGGSISLFWILVAMGPAVVALAGPGAAGWLTWGLLAGALVVWNVGFGAFVAALMRATPIDHPTLASPFAAVMARARVPAPAVLRAGTPGGRWPQALALPSGRHSRVIMGDTLLASLTPDEAAAIFAHEIAHLEHHQTADLRIAITRSHLLIGGALALLPLTHWLGWSASLVTTLWAFVIILYRRRVARKQKAHESHSDRRAVELCGGDPEPLVRALVKLHALANIPRRWEVKYEVVTSHPALSRRIQNIRAAGGLAQAPPISEHVLPSSDDGCVVLFGAEALEILRQVRAELPATPKALREQAGTVATIPYGHLVELRVEPDAGHGGRLVGRGTDGLSFDIPFGASEIARLQAALDGVDGKLHPHPVVARSGRGWAWTVMAVVVGLSLGTGGKWSGALIPMLLLCFAGDNLYALAAGGATGVGLAAVGAVTILRQARQDGSAAALICW